MVQKQSTESGSSGPRVLFGQREALAMDLPPNTILVVPSSDGWNDFGHHTRIDYRIRMRSSKEAVEASGFIGFINPESDRNGKDLLQQWVSTQGRSTVTATADHRFFTMLPDMEAYRQLVQTNGDKIEHRATITLASYVGGQAMLKLNLRDAVALAREFESERVATQRLTELPVLEKRAAAALTFWQHTTEAMKTHGADGGGVSPNPIFFRGHVPG